MKLLFPVPLSLSVAFRAAALATIFILPVVGSAAPVRIGAISGPTGKKPALPLSPSLALAITPGAPAVVSAPSSPSAAVGTTVLSGSASGTLVKSGVGTLTLSGMSTYSGTLTISAGSLFVGSSRATVPAGGLTSGSVNAPANPSTTAPISGMNPATAPTGTFNGNTPPAGNISLLNTGAGGTAVLLNPTGIAATGLTLGGANGATITGSSGFLGTGSANLLAAGSLLQSGGVKTTLPAGSFGAPVPEPSSALLAMLGASLLARRRRR